MPSYSMTAHYGSESSKRPGHAPNSHRRSSSSLTPELAHKVGGWLDAQPSASPFHPTTTKRRHESHGPSCWTLPSRKKSVHWAPDVVNNEKKPRRTSTTTRTSWDPSSSRSIVYESMLAPEPPRRRTPPPTPRFHRLPTPELSDVGCGDFCACGCGKDEFADKMSAQLAAAQSYIGKLNQNSRSMQERRH